MAPNIVNKILAPVAPYTLILVPHTVDPISNAKFDVKKETFGFFNKEKLEETLRTYKHDSENNNFAADGADAWSLRKFITPHRQFQQGKKENNITYVCFSQFSGDVCVGQRYPQDYKVDIHPDFKKYFPLKN